MKIKYTWLLFFLFFNSCFPSSEKNNITSILEETTKTRFLIPENPYSSSVKVAYYDSLIQNSSPFEKNKLKYQKAVSLLYGGKTTEAIEIFQEFYDLKKINYFVEGLGNYEEESIEKMLALSYLRLGEQQNCNLNHTSASCIIPIQPEGFHQLRSGSSEAIRIYTEILKKNPQDLESRWLLNIAYMTLGDYPHHVPAQFLIPETSFKSEYPLERFTDVAPQLNLDVNGLSGGSIVDDFNNDGYLDIVVSSWFLTHSLKIFINDQQGSFIEQSAQFGLEEVAGGLNMVQADYDNDGNLDIFLLRGAWMDTLGLYPNSLLKNMGNGSFKDVTIEAGLLSYHPTQTATWSDFNNDGWLDLFIGNESSSKGNIHPCELFLNNQDGTFREAAAEAGVQISSEEDFYYVKGVISGDYDHDGWQDLYISTIDQDKPNILLKNTGTIEKGVPQFVNVTEKAGLAENLPSFTSWFCDFNNDGLLDLYVPGYGRSFGTLSSVSSDITAEMLGLPHTAAMPRLYRNVGNGKFANVAEEVNLDKISYAMGANYGDLDNDGFLDFYLSTGEPGFASIIPNRMFRNAGGEKFQEVTSSGGFGHLQKGHGVSFADLDNDGDQDIYVVLGGAFEGDNFQNALFLNPFGNSKNWINLKLEGTTANKSAIGSKVKLKIKSSDKESIIYREINSGGSFGCNPLLLQAGLDDHEMVDELEIIWAGSGLKQSFKNVTANQFIKIIEGDNQIYKRNIKELSFDKGKQKHHHMANSGF